MIRVHITILGLLYWLYELRGHRNEDKIKTSKMLRGHIEVLFSFLKGFNYSARLRRALTRQNNARVIFDTGTFTGLRASLNPHKNGVEGLRRGLLLFTFSGNSDLSLPEDVELFYNSMKMASEASICLRASFPKPSKIV